MPRRNRVVVTGVGVLAANGIGKQEFWNSLCRGQSGIGPVTLCDVEGVSCQIAGEVSEFDPARYLDGKIKPKRLSRTSQLAVAAAQLGISDAGLQPADLDISPPLSIVVGISLGGFDLIEREIRRIVENGSSAMRPSVVGCQHLLVAKSIADVLGIEARIETLSNTCVGGLDAVARGVEMIGKGSARMVLAGASDAPIETCLMAGFSAARMLSSYNRDPCEASRPFDRDAKGGVLAEGSGIVVLERLESALARGRMPYAEIVGTGSASDPAQSRPGAGLELSMRQALANAGWHPDLVEIINAHGPGDPQIDACEIEAIKRVFADKARRVPVHSIKGNTGNPLAAGGIHQLIASALGLREGMIPPTLNLDHPLDECDLHIVAGKAARNDSRRVLINSHGMGGINTSMLIERYCDADV